MNPQDQNNQQGQMPPQAAGQYPPQPSGQMPVGQPMPPQAAQPGPMPQGQQPLPQPPPRNPNSTQNTLLIAEIREGIVIMNDGSFRAVVMAQAINFDLMSSEERESVEYAYQGFLNSLFFPIQVFVRSKKIDMKPYLEKLKRKRLEQDNMLLGLLMDDYQQFIELLVQETNIMDKQFYVTIPFYPNADLQQVTEDSKRFLTSFLKPKQQQQVVTVDANAIQKAKDELRDRVQLVVSGLGQAGIQSVALDTEELIELYYDSYNPDTATRQHIQNYSELTTPVVTKGQGEAQRIQSRDIDV